jgi:hypothetical protein
MKLSVGRFGRSSIQAAMRRFRSIRHPPQRMFPRILMGEAALFFNDQNENPEMISREFPHNAEQIPARSAIRV